MEKTVFIYALCEPGTRTIRYIGKSKNPGQRLIAHCNESYKQENYLGHWLSSLKRDSKLPALLVLKEVPASEWEEWEKRYIRCARSLGFKLVNGTEGGDGINSPMPDAIRQKISLSKCGKPLSLETRKKMSGKVPWNKGKAMSDLVKEKLRLKRIGFVHSIQSRIKQSASQTGKKPKSNTSGFVGVCWCKDKKKWLSRLKKKHLGRFSKIEDAVFVRALALDKLGKV